MGPGTWKSTTEATNKAVEILKSALVCPSASSKDEEFLSNAEFVANVTNQHSPFLNYLPPTLSGEFQRSRNIQPQRTPSNSHEAQANSDTNVNYKDLQIPDGMKLSTWLAQEAYLSRVRLDLLKRPNISSHCTINLKKKKTQFGDMASKLRNVIHSPKTPNLIDLEVGNVNFRVFADGVMNLNSASSFVELRKAVETCVANLYKVGYFEGTETALEDLKRDCVESMERNAHVQVSARLPWNYDFDKLMGDASTTIELRKVFAYDPENSASIRFALKCSGKAVKGHLGPTGRFGIKSAKTIEMAQEAFVRILLSTRDYRC